ncbi:hypothetical protein RRG08_020004 [Elysia crispata]|uniref:Uncharacterized protein n=1 Tax=Elysia crispata TaxID=231223 RepID=A0AAE1EEF1_9GAST|nr:hypothetical protein RRG08_020004 [Elysia crispata]
MHLSEHVKTCVRSLQRHTPIRARQDMCQILTATYTYPSTSRHVSDPDSVIHLSEHVKTYVADVNAPVRDVEVPDSEVTITHYTIVLSRQTAGLSQLVKPNQSWYPLSHGYRE